MKKRKSYKAAVAATAIILMSALSVSAAMRFLTPKEVAMELSGKDIAEIFDTDQAILVNEKQEGEQYDFTLLGMAEGKSLHLDESGANVDSNAFYAVVAISNKDGSDLSLEEFQNSENGYFISPLIQGLLPWQYNMASMHGSYSQGEINGVVYRVMDCDKISYFADRKLYLCVSDTTFYETNAYDYDEATGTLAPNPSYDGTNLLFDLPIDSSKADSALAEAYLKELESEWSSDRDDADEDAFDIENPAALADYTMLKEVFDHAPEDLDAVLTNMGMTVTDKMTVHAEDDVFSFKRVSKDDDSSESEFVVHKELLGSSIDHFYSYSESETEAVLEIGVTVLNEDGTATCTFYEKRYPME